MLVPLLLATLPGIAVQAPVIRLDRPEVAAREEFADIRGLRELPDGALLVSDYLDQRVVRLDLATGSVRSLVREGGGPTEARLPTRLIPARGDSTLLVDLGNSRLQLFDGNGRIVRTIPVTVEGGLGVRGVSATGEHYFAVPAWSEGPNALANDSVRVVRWNPANGVRQQVAVIQGDRMRSDVRQPSMVPRIPIVGYAAQDAWVIDDEGALRIVRGGDYRVESHRAGREPVVGEPNRYPTRAVTRAERERFVHRFSAQSPTSGRGPGGGLGQAPMPSEQELAALVEGTQFAERHAYFDPGRVVTAPGGVLWVGRPVLDGEPVQYDRFDRNGRMVGAVQLRPGRRVMAVTRRGVYVVAEDEDGLQTIERYHLR